MDKFNPILFTARLLDNYIGARQTQSSSQLNSKVMSENQKSSSQEFRQSFTSVRLTPFETPKIQNLNTEQKTAYLKDLLELPREFKEFLNEIAKLTQNQTTGDKNANNLIKMALVQKLLGENADVATQKLMQLISNATRAGVKDIAQLKEMLAMTGASISAAGSDSSKAIKNLMLLYLPWVPVGENKQKQPDFDIDFFDDKNSNESEEKDENIETANIFIQTRHYGNISAMLEAKKGGKITVLINCVDDFPKGMFVKLFHEKAKSEGLSSEIITQDIKQKEQDQGQNETDVQKVRMSAQSMVSPQLLMMSYLLIRLVIETDNNYTP